MRILGWLTLLRSHYPPLAAITRANYVIYLRRMLEELAWTGTNWTTRRRAISSTSRRDTSDVTPSTLLTA